MEGAHYKLSLILIIAFVILISCQNEEEVLFSGKKIQVIKHANKYQLLVDQKLFFIKGACGNDYLGDIKLAGGNTLRTYDTINLKNILDEAYKNNLYVIAGIPLLRREPEFDYRNQQQVDSLKSAISFTINQYKDHPALLMWGLGNEIFLANPFKDYNFYLKINDLIDLIKVHDQDHPVTTMILHANLNRRILKAWLGNLNFDILCFNTFGRISRLQNEVNNTQLFYNKPYIISEWGVNGPWEEQKTLWHAPIEPSSYYKAEKIKERYSNSIANSTQCLGSCIFMWGHKQETTSTWFSIFDESGKKTEIFSGCAKIWADNNPDIYYPSIDYILINGKGAQENVLLKAKSENTVDVKMISDTLTSYNIEIELLQEGLLLSYWEEKQKKPEELNHLINFKSKGLFSFTAPQKEGPYRLFVKAYQDSTCSTANFPFYVVE